MKATTTVLTNERKDFIGKLSSFSVLFLLEILNKNDILFFLSFFFFSLDRRSEVAFRTLSADFVLEVAITDEELLDHFFSYLDAPTGKKESSHFFRTIVVFLDRYSHELMLYLRSRDGIVRKIIQNVEDQSIVDLLYKFVDAGTSIFFFFLFFFVSTENYTFT